MKRIALFNGAFLDDLEREVNSFLAKLHTAKSIDIKLSESDETVTVMVVWEEDD